MNTTRINDFLGVLAMLNEGCDHMTEYEIVELPLNKSLTDALNTYYASLKTDRHGPFPAEWWHITIQAIPDWRAYLYESAHRWFFEKTYSPVVDREWVRKNVTTHLIQMIDEEFGEATGFQIRTAPPIWYGNEYEEIAFESRRGFALLHFSHSD